MAKKREEKFSPRSYSNKLASKYDMRCDRYNTLWLYMSDTGVWSSNGERLIEKELREWHLDFDHIGTHYVKEIVSDLKSLCLEDKDFPPPPWHLIPFNNGSYNLKTREFSDFRPEFNFVSKLAVNYNSRNKGCPVINGIFGELVGEGDETDLWELAAYCMVPTDKNQEVYFLLGSGRNGKSVYAYILTRLLGKQNVSAVSLHDLQHNRFSGAEFHGKFCNISSELRYTDLANTDLLKKLSGGDLIHAERKFQQPFTFVNHAKLVFVTNELPRTTDKTRAFYRRLRIIRFPYVFEGHKEDKMLKDKITDEELEGLAFKCIQILQDMMTRNFTFTRQKTTQDIAEEYEKMSNPIETFINQYCEADTDGFIAKTDFKDKLDGWLRNTGQRIRMDKEIAQHMKDKGIDDKKRTFGGNVRKNAWMGIKWKA